MIKETITTDALLELINHQSELIEQKDKQIIDLQERLDYMLRQKFSSSSEKSSINQPSLFDEDIKHIEQEEDTEVEKITITRRKRGNKKVPPDSLPHIRIEHDLKDEDKICECGCQMKPIKEIISHQYDVIPAKFQVIENVRFVYACSCKCGSKLKTSPLAPQVLPRHQVTPSFLATIAVQKFEDALPLERQAKIYKQRFGVRFTSTTFSEWMIKVSKLRLEAVINKLQEIQLQSGYIQADETTLQVLKEPNKKANSKSYIWLKVSQDKYPIVLLHYKDNRSSQSANTLFKGFTGYLQTDGYNGYNSVANTEGVTQLGCWAHARRKFADILKSNISDQDSKALASKAVTLISELYKIEKLIKDKPPNEKVIVRQKESKAIIENIKEWLDKYFFEAQKLGGSIAKAFVYLNNQFEKLSIYLEDGRLYIDNNRSENHIRPIALGRKNWLFATSTKGAVALANWYSIIETAKANNLDPFNYIEYLLTQLPIYQSEQKDIAPLLPWNVSLS